MFDNRGHFRIASRADLLEAIALNERAGARGMAHLFRALLSGRINLYPILSDCSASKFKQFARLAKGPTIALIGDDDGLNRGPSSWCIAARAVRWATAVVVHGAGAEVVHYEAAIRASERGHRVLFIECGSATQAAWQSLAVAAQHRPAVLMIFPRDGVHPVPADPRAVQ